MRLGTQVTIRLDPDDADRLREIAWRTKLPYTTMLREWVQERLASEPRVPPRVVVQTGGQAGVARVQVSGAGWLV